MGDYRSNLNDPFVPGKAPDEHNSSSGYQYNPYSTVRRNENMSNPVVPDKIPGEYNPPSGYNYNPYSTLRQNENLNNPVVPSKVPDEHNPSSGYQYNPYSTVGKSENLSNPVVADKISDEHNPPPGYNYNPFPTLHQNENLNNPVVPSKVPDEHNPSSGYIYNPYSTLRQNENLNNPLVPSKVPDGNNLEAGYSQNYNSTVRKSNTQKFVPVSNNGLVGQSHNIPFKPNEGFYNTATVKKTGLFGDGGGPDSTANNSYSNPNDLSSLTEGSIADSYIANNIEHFSGNAPNLHNNSYEVQNTPMYNLDIKSHEPVPGNLYQIPNYSGNSFDQESHIPKIPENSNNFPQYVNYNNHPVNPWGNAFGQAPPKELQQTYNIEKNNKDFFNSTGIPQNPNYEENKIPPDNLPDLGLPPRISHLDLKNFIAPNQAKHSEVNNLESNYPEANVHDQNSSLNQEKFNPAINENLRKSIRISTVNKKKNNEYSAITGKFDHYCEKSNIIPLKIENPMPLTDFETPIDTISKTWIKIDIMKNVAKYNKQFVNCIDTLKFEHKIVAWKKSRGDGNCYFRSVISRYFEIIFGFYSSLENCEYFKKILEDLLSKYENPRKVQEFYINSIKYIHGCVQELINIKTNDPYTAFNTALFWLQNPDFDINLVRVSRVICLNAYCNKKIEWKQIGIYNKYTKQVILEMGTEAEGIVLVLLPLGLDIQVIQYNIFDKIHIETFPSDVQSNIIIHIVRRSGHYDIVYTIQESELDLYNLDIGTYHYIN